MGLFSFLGGLLGLGGTPTQEIKVSKASAVAGLPIIYGRRRITPVKVYKTVSRHNAPPGSLGQYDHTILPSSGGDEEVRKDYDWLHRVDVWGQGEITGILKFWIDGDEATARRFGGKPYFRALSKYGSETQAAMSALMAASDVWSSTHKGLGVAYSWVRFFNSSKKPQFSAEPEVKALVQGLRVFDPREAAQSFTDRSTWAYSNNRALVVLNYLMSPYGFNAGQDDIDLDSFSLAADQCDVEMTIPGVLVNTTSGPAERVWDPRYGEFVDVDFGAPYPGYREFQNGTSQARWLADAVIDPKAGVIKNLQTLLEGFGWSMPWSNGRHRLVLEDEVQAPVMTLTADDIIGGWTVEHGMRDQRLNRVTLEFANANKDYEDDAVSWPLLDSDTYATFKAEDQGEDLHTSDSLKTITDYYQAQAYAEFLVRKSRVAHRVEGIKLARRALVLEPGDVVRIDYAERGFNGLWFIVEKISITAMLEVTADLMLYDPTVYGGEPLAQEPLNTLGDAPDLWSDPAAPDDLQLVSFHEAKADGSMISGIDVSWNAPLSTAGVERFELKWRRAGTTAFDGQRYLARDTTTARIDGLVDGAFYDVRLTYWTQRGQESLEAEQTIELPATPSKLNEIEDGATRNVFRGVYDDSATYVRGDVVVYEGSSYVFTSFSAATGVEPTDTALWTLLAGRGPQGVPGAPGADGQATYTWIRYADNASGSGISNDPTGKAYIGFGYNKFTPYESNVASDYAWSLVQGPQGNTGVPGAPGSDGQTTYTWIKYSANADGSGLTDAPQSGTRYIGIATNKTTASESNNKSQYTWSQWRGEDGSNGLTINASPTSHTVACSPDGTPKAGEFNKTSQIALFAGTSNVASSASYSRVTSNCSASVNGSGLVTITGIGADSAYVDVTATYAGVPVTVRISLSKSKDGTSATYAEAQVYPSGASSYTQHALPGVLTLALPGGGTVHMAARVNFRASGSGDTQYMRFQRRPAGGTWQTVLTADPVFADSGEPAFMTANYGYAAPATAGVWEYRLLQRHTGTGAGLQGNPGSFSVRLG
ncbi:phage tail protein [Kordiimonas sp.]|uniref:phage tail protein n=1 Tax=Kordiimonas sp. TaxID=1970157 RepID=UPI003A917F7E